VIQFEGALKLLMWLPGEQAKNNRSKAAKIILLYYTGDKKLLHEGWVSASHDEATTGGAQPKQDSEGQIFMEKFATSEPWEASNMHMKEHITLKQRLYDMEVTYEQKRLDAIDKMHTKQIEHEKAQIMVSSLKHAKELEQKWAWHDFAHYQKGKQAKYEWEQQEMADMQQYKKAEAEAQIVLLKELAKLDIAKKSQAQELDHKREMKKLTGM
jgi:hypothetical protein